MSEVSAIFWVVEKISLYVFKVLSQEAVLLLQKDSFCGTEEKLPKLSYTEIMSLLPNTSSRI